MVWDISVGRELPIVGFSSRKAGEGPDGVPAGAFFSHHFKMDPETFDFEIGVPVATAVTASGRVKPGRLPAARVARTIFHGGYEGLGAAWGEFGAWIKTNGHTPAENLWEIYATGPESGPDPSGWRTELNRPLIG